MCSPPRIPVYTQARDVAQIAQPQIVGWQFRSQPPAHGPTYFAEPSVMPKMRVSVSPPRTVAPHSAQLLGGGSSCRVPVPWCSGASIRVPSPVPEGVRAEPRWRNTMPPSIPGPIPGPPKRGSCPCPLSEKSQVWHMARTPRASHPTTLRPGPAPCRTSNWRQASPEGRATVPTYVAPCQFSPRTARSPSPQRFANPVSVRTASPLLVRSPITYHVHRGSAPARTSRERASRTPSPCAPVFASGQPLRVAALPSNQVGDAWTQREKIQYGSIWYL